jgi:hypothetical protein
MMTYDRRCISEQVKPEEPKKPGFWNEYYTIGLITFLIAVLWLLT